MAKLFWSRWLDFGSLMTLTLLWTITIAKQTNTWWRIGQYQLSTPVMHRCFLIGHGIVNTTSLFLIISHCFTVMVSNQLAFRIRRADHDPSVQRSPFPHWSPSQPKRDFHSRDMHKLFLKISKKYIYIFYISNRNFNPEIKLTHFVQATNQARLCLTVQN